MFEQMHEVLKMEKIITWIVHTNLLSPISLWLTGPRIMGTQRQRLRAHITTAMAPGVFWWFSEFNSMKENGQKKPRGILRFISVRENGQKSRLSPHVQHQPGHFRLVGSPPSSFFVLISHACARCWRHSLLLPHAYEGAAPGQTITCTSSNKHAQRDTPHEWRASPYTYWSCRLSPFPSLSWLVPSY
jgi:hypothetical protein